MPEEVFEEILQILRRDREAEETKDYEEALRRSREAEKTGALELDLSCLQKLNRLPQELAGLTRFIR